jgi:hypothetical protein
MRLIVTVLVLTLVAFSPAAAQDPSPAAVEDPSPTADSRLPIGEYHDNAILLDDMVEDLVAVEGRPWEALVVHADGRTIDIYFSGTDPNCTKLHDLEVGIRPTGLDIMVRTGRPTEVTACRDRGGVPYVVTVELEQTLFGGGHDADHS